MSEHIPYGDCPEIEICPEVDCDNCRNSVNRLFVISDELLVRQQMAFNKNDHMEFIKVINEVFDSPPFSDELKKGRENALNEFMKAIEFRFDDTNQGRGVVGTIRGIKESLRTMSHSEQHKDMMDYCTKRITTLTQKITADELSKYPEYYREFIHRQIKGRIMELQKFKSNIARNHWNEPMTEYLTCQWSVDENGAYDTTCGNKYEIMNGTPENNKMIYCPFCGYLLWSES